MESADSEEVEVHAEYIWVNPGLLRCGCLCGVRFTMLPDPSDSQTTPIWGFEAELKKVLGLLGCTAVW